MSVDDVHIPSVRVPTEYLKQERPHSLVKTIGPGVAVFQNERLVVPPNVADWQEQRMNQVRKTSLRSRVRRLGAKIVGSWLGW